MYLVPMPPCFTLLSDTWLAFECDVQGSITLYDVVSTGKHTLHTFKTVVDTEAVHSIVGTNGLPSPHTSPASAFADLIRGVSLGGQSNINHNIAPLFQKRATFWM